MLTCSPSKQARVISAPRLQVCREVEAKVLHHPEELFLAMRTANDLQCIPDCAELVQPTSGPLHPSPVLVMLASAILSGRSANPPLSHQHWCCATSPSTLAAFPCESGRAPQVLCLQGFLAARKHADRIILLAEMMQHSGCPCFRSGSAKALAALRRRFHLSATESQARLWGTGDRLSGVRASALNPARGSTPACSSGCVCVCVCMAGTPCTADHGVSVSQCCRAGFREWPRCHNSMQRGVSDPCARNHTVCSSR